VANETPDEIELPSFDELPDAEGGGKTAWHLFGQHDDVGLINLQTPHRTLAAARAVRTGKVFSLSPPLDLVDPPLFDRRRPEHHVKRHEIGMDDWLDGFYLQGSAQWDSLGHIAFRPERYYNGVSGDDIVEGGRNSVLHWGLRGIAGRGVVLDMTTAHVHDGRPYDPGSRHGFTVAELDRAAEAAGVTIEPGDVLLLHTGWLRWYQDQPTATKESFASREHLRAPGLAPSEDMARWLWDHHVCAVAADNPAVERCPVGDRTASPYAFLHTQLIGGFGMALGELWWLDDLVRDCVDDGVYEVLLVSAPLPLRGGIGSPANALAIK